VWERYWPARSAMMAPTSRARERYICTRLVEALGSYTLATLSAEVIERPATPTSTSGGCGR